MDLISPNSRGHQYFIMHWARIGALATSFSLLVACGADCSANHPSAVDQLPGADRPVPLQGKPAVVASSGTSLFILDGVGEKLRKIPLDSSGPLSFHDLKHDKIYAYDESMVMAVDLASGDVSPLAEIDLGESYCRTGELSGPKLRSRSFGVDEDGQWLCMHLEYEAEGSDFAPALRVGAAVDLSSGEPSYHVIEDRQGLCEQSDAAFSCDPHRPWVSPPATPGTGATFDRENCRVTMASGTHIEFDGHDDSWRYLCALDVVGSSASGRFLRIRTISHEYDGDSYSSYEYLDLTEERLLPLGHSLSDEPRIRRRTPAPAFHPRADLVVGEDSILFFHPQTRQEHFKGGVAIIADEP